MAFDGIVRKKLRAHILRDSGTKGVRGSTVTRWANFHDLFLKPHAKWWSTKSRAQSMSRRNLRSLVGCNRNDTAPYN